MFPDMVAEILTHTLRTFQYVVGRSDVAKRTIQAGILQTIAKAHLAFQKYMLAQRGGQLLTLPSSSRSTIIAFATGS